MNKNTMTLTPELAVQLCITAHWGQKDKQDMPYFYHPVAVAMQFRDETNQIIALLHDVFEDTTLFKDFEQFQDAFIGHDEIVESLKHLTRRKKETYDAYIKRVSQNKRATLVKLADLKHNLSRMESLRMFVQPQEIDRLSARYKLAKLYLESVIREKRWDT